MTIDREALLAKATWFRRCPNTGEYSGEYCSVRPYDDSNMVPMISVDAALSALDQPAQEPEGWIVECITGPHYGPRRRLIDAKKYNAESDDFWMEGAKERHRITPLYASPQPATLPDDLSFAISQLRALCNDKIRKINQGRGVKTEGFRDINDLLKACDKVFATLPD